MNSDQIHNWNNANQRYLSARLAFVKNALARKVNDSDSLVDETELTQTVEDAAQAMPTPAALERLCQIFGLTEFERDVLLLCLGAELEHSFTRLLTILQGSAERAYPTFGIALSILDHAHWSALSPDGALRHHQLIELELGRTLTQSPLRINERILHFLNGIQHVDERLKGLLRPMPVQADLVPSHLQLAEQVATILARAWSMGDPPVVQLCGLGAEKGNIAAMAAKMIGLGLCQLSAQVAPTAVVEVETLIRLWARESAIMANALLLDCDHWSENEPTRRAMAVRLIESSPRLLLITCRDRLHIPNRQVISFEVSKPTSEEQQFVWQGSLKQLLPSMNGELSGTIQQLVTQFNLTSGAIRNVCHDAIGLQPEEEQETLADRLWQTCRMQARPRLDELAQRIESKANWADLVLPKAQSEILQEASAHVRQRAKVYESWGFAAKGSRGLGISALFAGASGTGKTLAAEVLANELGLDLYRIDLSSVVSKYIGETEKNLRRVFDAAEDGGAILLFDEADALFGKRGEVKDSRDRYANIEVSYLLQRMECYPGLAILTTNLKSAIDAAFLRRIRFVVQFPFPDAKQRAEIWRRIFPGDTPTKGLKYEKLGQLNVAGGNIRNIALNAAFLAADEEQSVQMKHVLRAAGTEYTKLEKTLTESETRGWVKERKKV